MCGGRSSRCINVLIVLALLFSLISLILGILTYGLPYMYQSGGKRNFGFFQECEGVFNCTRLHSVTMSYPEHISSFSLFVIGIFFNFISLLILIICVARANKKYILIYMKLVIRIIVFFLLIIASSGYLIGMVISCVIFKQLKHATFVLGWITLGFSVLATIMIMITLCGKGVNSNSSHSKSENHTNYAYDGSMKFTPPEDVSQEVYRMYSRN